MKKRFSGQKRRKAASAGSKDPECAQKSAAEQALTRRDGACYPGPIS